MAVCQWSGALRLKVVLPTRPPAAVRRRPQAAKAKAKPRAALTETKQQQHNGLDRSHDTSSSKVASERELPAPVASALSALRGRSIDANIFSSSSEGSLADASSSSGSSIDASSSSDGSLAGANSDTGSGSGDGKQQGDDGSLLAGKLACLCVALLWGSYAPALRMVYSMDGPPGPVAVMLFRGVLQAAVLLSADAIATRRSARQTDPLATRSDASSSAADEQEEPSSGSSSSSSSQSWLGRLQAPDNIVLLGGLELGLWNFGATAVQTVGLTLTTATKAGFLIASTSLITPLLSTLLGERPQLSTWIGSVIALSGTLLIAADSADADPDMAMDGVWNMGGEVLIVCAAFFYSLATVRLSSYARLVPPVKLAAAKSLVLGSFAIFTAIGAIWAAQGDVESLWPGWQTAPMAWAVLIWSALGPGALAAFLHAKGQSTVPAADAQVIFSSTPLWSAAAAFVVLGGEPVSEKTWIGGAAIVVAGLVASRSWR